MSLPTFVTRHDIDTPAGRIAVHARVVGAPSDAPPVVLVHGFAIFGGYMLPLARQLAARHLVYAVDLPGHGRSGTPGRVLSVVEQADALARWMAAAGLARAVVVGHSMGAQIATRLAERHPARVAALALLAPTVDPARRTAWQQAWSLVADAPRERPSLVLLEVAGMVRLGPSRLVAEMACALTDHIEDALPSVRCPALVVRGGHDPLVPPEWGARVAALLGVPESVIADGAHAFNYSKADETARLLLDFLGGLR